ncbi:MAG: nucleotidyltransferase domain-containing protein [Trueperaceae bacterium]|nr:nucleotidyltransferase domain-containing protein [Trueperaceae bacterium]
MTSDELQRLHDVFESYPEVAGAWLFGSHARGTVRPDSDGDRAVDPATPDARARKLDLLTDLVGVGFDDVDLVVLDRDDPVLRWEAIGPNRLVYAAPGYDAEGAFVWALRQYDDTARLRAIQREAYYATWLSDDG